MSGPLVLSAPPCYPNSVAWALPWCGAGRELPCPGLGGFWAGEDGVQLDVEFELPSSTLSPRSPDLAARPGAGQTILQGARGSWADQREHKSPPRAAVRLLGPLRERPEASGPP